MSSCDRELMEALITAFAAEQENRMGDLTALSDERLWRLLRAFMNVRPASLPSAEVLAIQDELLRGLTAAKGVISLDDADVARSPLDPRLALWRGDITRLAVDGIVNAANSQLTGCWSPNHACIDNAIHTYAGVQLRAACDELMRAQGHKEPTGQAKITAAFNLPSKHVLHTVGPIAAGNPTPEHEQLLASSYRSCLELSEREGLRSIAFCSISTGVFGYPIELAAPVAVRAVREWLEETGSPMRVLFNVFSEHDEAVYRPLLEL